jgi:hypothetical protein
MINKSYYILILVFFSCRNDLQRETSVGQISQNPNNSAEIKIDSLLQLHFEVDKGNLQPYQTIYNIQLFNLCMFGTCHDNTYYFNTIVDTTSKSIKSNIYSCSLKKKIKGKKIIKSQKLENLNGIKAYFYEPKIVTINDSLVVFLLNNVDKYPIKKCKWMDGCINVMRVYRKKPNGEVDFWDFSGNYTDGDPIIVEFCNRLKKY